MSEILTDEERARIKARAIASLRRLEAELDGSEDIHRYQEMGQVQMGTPVLQETYNDALRDLQLAGEDIPDWMIRPAHTIPYRAHKRAPLEGWINASGLLSDIKHLLKRVNPQSKE